MRSKTYFCIVGHCDAKDVVRTLQLKPDDFFIEDEVSSKNPKLKYKYTNLEFGVVEKDTLYVDRQMLKTVSVLKDKVEKLNEIRKKYEVNFYLEVVLNLTVDADKPIISPPSEVIEFCYLTGCQIDYDYYLYDSDK